MTQDIVLIKSRLSHLGGAEKYARHLIQAFVNIGCNVTVVTSGKVEPMPNVTYHTMDERKLTSVQSIKAFERFCKEELKKIDAKTVLGLDRTSFQTHLRASNGVHAAYLRHRTHFEPWYKTLSFKVNPLHRTLLDLEKQAFLHPELETLIVNSHFVKDEILSLYPEVNPNKIEVVHNGVEWSEQEEPFRATFTDRADIIAALNLNPNHYHFVFIGHNYTRKGLIPLLKGLALLERRDFHLSVVGKEKNLSFFKRLTNKLGLNDQVQFFSHQKSPLPFYSLADCVVVPSFYDPFANVTIEALSMGVFVLSSKTNGGHEILTPDSGAIISDLNSPDAMKEALETAMKHPKTPKSSKRIRNSVKHLDFSKQLSTITTLCLTSQ